MPGITLTITLNIGIIIRSSSLINGIRTTDDVREIYDKKNGGSRVKGRSRCNYNVCLSIDTVTYLN